MNNAARIVLASNSPRRRSLLADLLGWEVLFVTPGVEEDVNGFRIPEDAVRHLAAQKAMSVASSYDDLFVIGADTIVYINGHILGKPSSVEEAFEMLLELNGRTHEVYTGIAVVKGEILRVDHEVTRVTFRDMSPKALLAYAETKEGLDKAGAYGVQGKGALLVERVEGCFYNVVGLPLAKLSAMLQDLGWPLEDQWRCVR